MKLNHLLSVLLFFTAVTASAHGEEKPGPHGGHIKMTSGFHTELEIDSVQGAHIFLLDMNSENPTVKDSSVTAVFKTKKEQIPYQCSIMGGNHFHCVPTKKLPTKGELVIKATRTNTVGNEVTYSIPLKAFENNPNPAPTDHSAHH